MKLFALVLSWVLVSFSGVLSPGPLSAMAFAGGIRWGFRAGPLLSTGHALAELGLIGGLALGLGKALRGDTVAQMVAVLGGGFLLWMGYGLIRDARRGNIELGQTRGQVAPLPAGALLSVFNPFWLIWWATVGVVYMGKFLGYGLLGLGIFYISHILTDYGWLSVLSLAGSSGGRVLGGKVHRAALYICGGFLMVVGVYFLGSEFQAF
ncbi:MAG TPA: hypothetical protein EYP17_08665 [Candidatus Latescibacteria bacterium]|nr:hypothetical protein [Candidatus Latescibacterota bacterium]